MHRRSPPDTQEDTTFAPCTPKRPMEHLPAAAATTSPRPRRRHHANETIHPCGTMPRLSSPEIVNSGSKDFEDEQGAEGRCMKRATAEKTDGDEAVAGRARFHPPRAPRHGRHPRHPARYRDHHMARLTGEMAGRRGHQPTEGRSAPRPHKRHEPAHRLARRPRPRQGRRRRRTGLLPRKAARALPRNFAARSGPGNSSEAAHLPRQRQGDEHSRLVRHRRWGLGRLANARGTDPHGRVQHRRDHEILRGRQRLHLRNRRQAARKPPHRPRRHLARQGEGRRVLAVSAWLSVAVLAERRKLTE